MDALPLSATGPCSLMRTPPPVSVRLGPEPAWEAVCACLSGLTGACLGLWLAHHALSLLPQAVRSSSSASLAEILVLSSWLAPLLLGIATAWVGWRYAKVDPLQLAWTGLTWQARPVSDCASADDAASDQASIQDASAPVGCIESGVLGPWQTCEPTLMIDLGGWMLLRLRLPGHGWLQASGMSWRAVSASQLGPWSWHGLRVALHCARTGASEYRDSDPAALS